MHYNAVECILEIYCNWNYLFFLINKHISLMWLCVHCVSMDTSLHVYVVLFCSVHAVKALPVLYIQVLVKSLMILVIYIYCRSIPSALFNLSLGTAIAISDCKISFVFLPPTPTLQCNMLKLRKSTLFHVDHKRNFKEQQ